MILITKASGQVVPFDSSKLRKSLLKAGADEQTIQRVVSQIESEMNEGMTTKSIYRSAFKMLRQKDSPLAAKYKLKQALLELGPTGYPFESYVAALYEAMGYGVKTGVYEQGKCVAHEIDVIAIKEQEIQFVECKFHNGSTIVTDVKVPLYIHSRVNDLLNASRLPDHSYVACIATNTRFTSDAIAYGLCAGIKMLSWDYPESNSLRELTDYYGLHPITCLTTLTSKEKNVLLEQKIVTVKHLQHAEKQLAALNIPKQRIQKVVRECELLTQAEV